MFKINHLAVAAILAAAAIPAVTYAQSNSAVDSVSDAAASNSGVNLLTDSHSKATAWSLLFPSTTPGLTTSVNCTGNGTREIGVAWNLIHGSWPEHTVLKACEMDRQIDKLGGRCQFYSAKRLEDDLVRMLGVKPEEAYESKDQYDIYVKTNFKNLSYKECTDLRAPVKQEEKKVEEKKPEPVAVVTPPAPAKDTATTYTSKRVNLSSTVLFRTAKHNLTDEGRSAILEALDGFDKKTAIIGTVEGHTDDVGGTVYNQKLSERRANEVAQFLRSQGFEVDKAVGYGKMRPAYKGKDASSRAGNRRVSLIVKQQESSKEVVVK